MRAPAPLFALAVALAAAPAARPQDPPFPPGDITGKAVIVGLKGQDRRSVALEQVRLQRLGPESFLVGVAADWPMTPGPYYPKGKTVWVAIGEVSTVTEFSSADALRKYIDDIARPVPAPPRPGQ
jgi:hypothetical protein